jgi:hypothetical protein
MGIDFKDLLERLIWTSIQSAGGTLMAAGAIDGIEIWHAAAISGLSGAVSVLTTFSRKRLGKINA